MPSKVLVPGRRSPEGHEQGRGQGAIPEVRLRPAVPPRLSNERLGPMDAESPVDEQEALIERPIVHRACSQPIPMVEALPIVGLGPGLDV